MSITFYLFEIYYCLALNKNNIFLKYLSMVFDKKIEKIFIYIYLT